MEQAMKDEIQNSIAGFSLPRYNEIPDVGLYLEQAAKYISGYLSCLGEFALTGSMISNYVKKGLIDNPVKKQYSREQIANLIFIAVAKTVMTMEDLRLVMMLRKKTYTAQRAYDYFREEMENVLPYVFGRKDSLDSLGVDNTDEKTLLRYTIITVAHKVYLDKFCAALHAEEEG